MESWEIEMLMVFLLIGISFIFGWMVGVNQYKKNKNE